MDYSIELSKTKYYYIENNKEQVLKIGLSIEPSSLYTQKERSEIVNRILYTFLTSSFFMVCIIIIFILYIKRYKKIKDNNTILNQEAIKLDIIKKARKTIQIFTNKFHNYDKRRCYNYKPCSNNYTTSLPIVLEKGWPLNTKQVFKIQTNNIIEACDFLIKEYNILHSYNIKFTSDIEIIAVILPFEQELFDQIIIGIMSNLLLFIKSNKHAYHIHLIIDRKTISFVHDIFNIDESMMIEYSEMIFQETLNPYILTFAQIITVLNDVYNLNCKIYNEFSKKLIKIELKEARVDEDNVILLSSKKTV